MHLPLRLIWKLLLINSVGLLLTILLVAVAVHWLAGSYFMSLMERFRIDPSEVHSMFLHSVDRFLLIAGTTGFIISSLLSLWLSYRLLKPISQIMHASQRISMGDYSNRVTVRGCGEIDTLSSVFNDMADHLQKAENFRKDFVVNVAHELRTPLTNIRGYMEGLRDGVVQPSEDVFASLHEETLRLVGLVEELLQLARADLARTNLHTEKLNLSELVEQNLRNFEPRFAEKQLRVAASHPIACIYGDEERLTQVLTNLFENALRYSPVGGQLQVAVHCNLDRIRFEIVNTLSGPTPTNAHKLFERFQRGDCSRSREYGGAGLGLAIVKELVEAHSGSVGCHFEAGTAKFWFEIPTAGQ